MRYDSDETTWLEAPSDRGLEGPWVERKTTCTARELARQLSGFANGQPPGGLVVVGVTPTGGIVGVAARRANVNEMLAKLKNNLEACGWRHRFVPVKDGQDEILFVFVPFSAHRVVCLQDGTAHCRRGDATQELTAEEIRELRHTRAEVRFEDEPALPYDEQKLDPALTSALLEGMRRRNGLTMPLTIESALQSRRLVTQRPEGKFITVAGMLAVAKDPLARLGGARVRFLRFEGREEKFGPELNVVKDRWFEGAVPKIVSALREFVRTQVREFEFLGADGKFVRDPEYPDFAWEEAIVNALVHRSYSISNACVFVRMFDDRIEVESPGGFPTAGVASPVDPSQLRSNPRNPNLVSALQYFDLVRLAQEGTRRMVQEMAQLGLPPPRIEVLEGPWIRVTLFNDIERRKGKQAGEDLQADWDEVARGISDSLAIYRRRAVQKWSDLHRRGAVPTAAVLDNALLALQGRSLGDSEGEQIVELLSAGSLGERMLPLANEYVGGRFRGREGLQSRIANLLSNSEPAFAVVLEWLQTPQVHQERDREAIESAFSAVQSRVQREPLPPRAWMEGIANLCLEFPEARSARLVYTLITGRQAPK